VYVNIECTSIAGSTSQRQWILSAGNTERDTAVAIRNLGRQVDAEERSNFTSLLADSIKRVQGYLSDPDCAKNFRDPAAAIRKAGTVGFSDQGVVQYTTQPNGEIAGRRGSPGVARYNSFTGSINLNSTVNWMEPNKTNALLDGASWVSDLLAGQAHALGVSSVTAGQYMDLTLLHELSHYTGAIGDPDRNEAVERMLWKDCIR
jgi:hypothetical protein